MPRDRHGEGRWDPEVRLAKARKIEALLRRRGELMGARVLDVGTGSGIIAATLAKAVGASGEVIATDVMDQRQDREGYRYVAVSDTFLPFDEHSFDIVVTNHVIEHVGGRDDQLNHLREIRRVLRQDGCCYLATPNRWTVMEPHFRLPFLSWLPPEAQGRYVRLFRRGSEYDCRLLARSELLTLFREARLAPEEHTLEAMGVMADVEDVGPLRRTLLRTPRSLLEAARPLIPTMIFLARWSS